MVRIWKPRKDVPAPLREQEFESRQKKLRTMSAEVVRRYQRELDAEISDPKRLAATYGASFAGTDAKRQASVVAMMAATMLKVPNADVNIVLADHQQSVASVRDYLPADEGDGCYSLDESWCKHVIATGREFAVTLANDHPLVCDTSVATSGGVVSYLGVPIANRDSIIVGVLCVHDSIARDWHAADVSMLTQLSFVLTRALPAPEKV